MKSINPRTWKMAKTGAVLLLAAIFALSIGASVNASDTGSRTVAVQASSFTDISKHWAKTAIEQAVQKGYVNGYEDGTFKPNREISRAEFTKMLVSALGLKVDAAQGGKWYDPYFTTASNAGITSAAEFNNHVDTALTRQEMAQLAMKALDAKEDTDAKKWIYLAAKAGIMSGSGAGDIGADKTTTRAESITVIERILSVKGGATLKADKYAVQAAEIYWHKTNIFTVMPEFFADTKSPTLYKPDDLFVKSEDGKYYAVVDAIVAIDLADPKDPNLKLLPPLSKLRWDNNLRDGGIPLTDKYKDSYVVLVQKHFVQTNSNYGKFLYADFYGGYYDDKSMKEFGKGVLNQQAGLFEVGKEDEIMNATIFPKKGFKTDTAICLYLRVPVNNSQPKLVLRAVPKF